MLRFNEKFRNFRFVLIVKFFDFQNLIHLYERLKGLKFFMIHISTIKSYAYFSCI